MIGAGPKQRNSFARNSEKQNVILVSGNPPIAYERERSACVGGEVKVAGSVPQYRPRSMRLLSSLSCALVFLTGFVAGFGPPPASAQDVSADRIAQRLMDAHGADAFAQVPLLRFDFVVEGDGTPGATMRHLWDRRTGDYRLEWTQNDSLFVAILNVNDVTDDVPAGAVYHNGEALSDTYGRQLKKDAYRRFINDTYWLLAPLKVMDAGVNRSYVADLSDDTHDVLHLTFGDVGLTPDDEYWLFVNRETGRLDRWMFHLQGMPDRADPAPFDWTEYKTLETPNGPVQLATRHQSETDPLAILTQAIAFPTEAPPNAFSRPQPMLDE